jgi:thiamine kinase-like enzyme
MNVRQIAALCAAFGLGWPVTAPVVVPGGRLHQVWRLDTSTGRYAVKRLNPALLATQGARARVIATERIAATLATAGIPAIAALAGPDGPLCEVPDATVLVYPWVDGATLAPSAAEPDRAAIIGWQLARIHGLDLRSDAMSALAWDAERLREDSWVLLARRAMAADLAWGRPLHELRQALAIWQARARPALTDLHHHQVVSHRDLDQRNVLWRDAHTPALLDWEAAGPTHPTVELADVALNWSGITTGLPDPTTFAAVVAGYRDAGGAQHAESRDVLYVVLYQWLTWLHFNARRALGELGADSEARHLAEREVTTTLGAVRALGAHVDRWASWLDAGLAPQFAAQ